MPWFKVDDRLAMHPKVMEAGNAAMGLWVRAGSWSAQNGTDGLIPKALLASLGGTHKQAEALVKARLWTSEPDSYRFHDWSEYQPSAADTKLHREASADSGRRGNHRRWHVRRGVKDLDCPYCIEGEK